MRLVRADGGRRVLFSSGTLGAGVLFDSGTLGTETGKAALDLLRSASLLVISVSCFRSFMFASFFLFCPTNDPISAANRAADCTTLSP